MLVLTTAVGELAIDLRGPAESQYWNADL